MTKKGKKVLVAMSGGVDSAAAAALLKSQGYQVAGVFMHFWKELSEDNSIENKCCSVESYEDLKKICRAINIPLYTLNVEKEFKKEVVDYFLREYKNGRTPNPCIVCNREIKFKLMLKKMLEMEADYVATGHYALMHKFKIEDKFTYKLYEAKDKNKDQSYFLYTLNQKQLAKILFPLSNYEKNKVRAMAKDFGISVHDKPESQDICFISSNIENFLKKYLKLKMGEIINEEGNLLGKHSGLPLYTIGQRKGLNLGGDGPYYVAGKDLQKNILLVTNKKEAKILLKKEVLLEKVTWVGEKPKFPAKILVRTRYRNPLVSAIIKANGRVIFAEAQRNITPGQSAVFYRKNREVLGGGIVESAH